MHYLTTIKYKDKFTKKAIDILDGFRSGVSDFLIITLVILWFVKGS